MFQYYFITREAVYIASMWHCFWPLASWLFVLCYHATIGYCTLLYDDLRLAAFTVPDFRTSFILRSNNGSDSFREVQTGHNQMPFNVRVYAKVLNGDNVGFCFEGVGSAQVSARKTSYPLGGIIFAYDKSRVRIWAPSVYRGKGANGRIVFVSQGWGDERYRQTCSEALVVVEVWYIGPAPSFQTNTFVDTQNTNHVFVQVDHKLGQIPERVAVRVTPFVGQDSQKPSPNEGFWFNGITASQNLEKKGYGGVIFAYDEQKILLWVPNSTTKKTGCVFVTNGWGNELYAEIAPKCIVHIFAWILKFPVPTFKTEWKYMISQGSSDQTFLEINHLLNMLPALVVVQGRIGNKGLIFEATGAVMSTDNNSRGYGGILFAYDKNSVRIWLPKRHQNNGTKNGYSILVKKGWGISEMLQESHNVRVRVVIYTSNCDPRKETVTEKGICKSIEYNSYQWIAGLWGRCSSICNKGVNRREILGMSELFISQIYESDVGSIIQETAIVCI